MQARINRGEHTVDASGPCMSLQTMVPSIIAMPQANGVLRYPLVFVAWLLLPVIRPGNDVPDATLLADVILHVARLGVAFERCILGGLDTSACTPSVARARVKRLGLRLAVIDPAPFTAVNADWYPTVPTAAVGGVVQPVAHPGEAAIALLLWMVGGDGTFEPLADAEAVLLPRVHPAERLAGCGFDYLFSPATQAVNATLPVGLVALIPVVDRAKSAVDHMIARAVDPMLADLENSGPTRIAHMRRMTMAETLGPGNVAVALPHLNVLSLAVEPGATNNVEALRLIGEIERAVLGKVVLDLSSVCATNREIQFLEPRMLRPDVQGMPSSDRVAVLLGEHATAVARERSSAPQRAAPAPAGGGGASGGGAGGGGGGAGAKMGYAPAYSHDLRLKLGSALFQATDAALSRLCFGVAAGPGGAPAAVPPEHPYVCITAILRSREIIFWHALLGYLVMLPGVRLVQHIATMVAPHGPAWLGDLACRCILPPGGAVQIPPELSAEWNSFCAGNLLLDFETLECRVRAWGVSKTATWDQIPEAQRWTSKARLTSMTRIVPPMLEEFGYPSLAGVAGTPVDLFGLAGTYADEAKALLQSSVFGNIRLTITSVLQETSRRLKMDLGAGDPMRSVAGVFVQSDSIHALVLITARANVSGQNKLQQDLAMLPGHATKTTHIAADDLTASTRTPGPSLEEDEKAARGQTDAAAKTAAAKAAKALKAEKEASKKAKIGSKCVYLVDPSPNGKFVYLGPKSQGDERMIVSKEKFEAVAPAGACLPVWCASHKFPWVLCNQKDHPEHQTPTGGAHAVRAGFKTTVQTLLVTAAVVAQSASVGEATRVIPDWYVDTGGTQGTGLLSALGSLAPSGLLTGGTPLVSRGASPVLSPIVGLAGAAGLDLNETSVHPLPPGLGLEPRRGVSPPSLPSSVAAASPPVAFAAGVAQVVPRALGPLERPDRGGVAEAGSRLTAVKMAVRPDPPLFLAGGLRSINLWVTKSSPEPTLFFHEPSLRLIESGDKTEEARLWADPSSAGLRPGQVVVGISKERRVAMLVLKNERWDGGFGAAWEVLRDSLVPLEWVTLASAVEADELYQTFYKRPIFGIGSGGVRWTEPVRILTIRALASVHTALRSGQGPPHEFPVLASLKRRADQRATSLLSEGKGPGPLLGLLGRTLDHALKHGLSDSSEVVLSHAFSREGDFFAEAGVDLMLPPPHTGGEGAPAAVSTGGGAPVSKGGFDPCEWLRRALAATVAGTLDDIVLNHLILSLGLRRVTQGTQRAVRSALQVLSGTMGRADANRRERPTERSEGRWLSRLRDLLADCEESAVVEATLLPSAPAATSSSLPPAAVGVGRHAAVADLSVMQPRVPQSWMDSSGSDTGSECSNRSVFRSPLELEGSPFELEMLERLRASKTPGESRTRLLWLLNALPPAASVAHLSDDAARAGLVRVPSPGAEDRAAAAVAPPRALRVLHLCSGPYNRPSGLKDQLGRSSILVEEFDKYAAPGVLDPLGDVERDEVFLPLLERCRARSFGAVVMGAPCSPCSVARVFNTHSGPPMLFSARCPEGLRPREVPFAYRREQAKAKLVYDRLAQLAAAVVEGGGLLFAEHPSPRSNEAFLGGRLWDHDKGLTANHGSWWDMNSTKNLLEGANAHSVTLAYCSLPGASGRARFEQKYTTLGFSPELEPFVGPLGACVCAHTPGFHTKAGGHEASGAWRMAKLARWPQGLLDPLAQGLVAVLANHGSPSTEEPPPCRVNRHHMLGPPLVDTTLASGGAIILLPILVDGQVTRIGLPGGSLAAAFGRPIGNGSRDSCGLQAQSWTDSLFAPRDDVYAYYQMTVDVDSASPLLVVTAVVNHPLPHDLASGRVDSTSALLAHTGPGLAWASADALEDRLFLALGASQIGLAEMTAPACEYRRARVTRGGLELTPVVMRGGTVRSGATRMDWQTEVVPEALATCEALRTEFRRLCSVPGTPPDLVEGYKSWYDAIKRPAFEQINPQLRSSCFRADDPRLASIPFPSHAVPVPSDPMAPLPDPPDQRLVPSWATCLETHALRPAYRKELLKARARVHERLLWSWQHNGDMVGAPPPIFFAFNSEGYEEWAAKLVRAGHVLEQGDGCIRLSDLSRMPPSLWNIDYLDAFLRFSIDKGLHCATCTHGFSYLCERDPTTMVQDHLQSLYGRGLGSVHKEMSRLTTLKRYGVVKFPQGLNVTRLPVLYGANGTVPRPSDPSRDRRICDGRSPRKQRKTWDKSSRVLSIGDTCGWDASKAIHRAASHKPGWLRHSPAFRKQPLASLMSGPAQRITASSTTPSQARAMAVGEGLSSAEVERRVAEHATRPRHAMELKWLFADFMLACCILGLGGHLLGEPLVSFEDDEADCFFQFFTAMFQRHDSFIAMLDPEAVLNGDFDPCAADIEEWVTSMGIPPVSCFAQRFNTEVGEEYERLCAKDDVGPIAALRGSNAKFDEWCAMRDGIAVHTGRVECALMKCMFYTDDPIIVNVGVERTGRNVTTWIKHMGPRGCNIIMGTHLKLRMGVDPSWIGGKGLLTGFVAYISDQKQCKTIDCIDAVVAGKADLETYEKLAGLLNHLVCLLCMPYNVMYGIYEVHDRARELKLSGTDKAPLTANAVKSLATWRQSILECAGTPMLAAAFDTNAPPVGVAVRRMASDASRTATKGDVLTEPAIVGNLYERVWIVKLGAAELELPIVVTEFLGPIFNLIIFYPYLVGTPGEGTAPTALLIDSLCVPIIMTSRASHGSPMMQWLHNLLLDLPEFVALADSLYAGQWYGPRNFITDAGTRGRLQEMETVMRQMGMEPEWMHVPERCYRILHEAVEMWRALTDEERYLGEQFGSSSDGAFRYLPSLWVVVVGATCPSAEPRQRFSRRLSWVADIFELVVERLGLGHRSTHALEIVGGRQLGLAEVLGEVAPEPQEWLLVRLVPLSQQYDPNNFVSDAASRERRQGVRRERALTDEERYLGEQFGSSSDGAFRYLPSRDGEPMFAHTPRPTPSGSAAASGFPAAPHPARAAAAPPTVTPSVALGWTDWRLVTGSVRVPTEVTAATANVLGSLTRPVPEPTMRAAPRTQVRMPTFLAQPPGPATRAERGESSAAAAPPVARATGGPVGMSPSRLNDAAHALDAGAEGHVDRMVGRGRLLEELSAFNIGSLSLTAPPSADADTSATGLIMGALEGTTSAFALRPLDPTMLYAMADAVADTLSHSYAESTRSKQAGHMKKWANVCRYFDTPVWRTDRAANCGADPNGHVNECVLQAFALLAFYVDMEPRAHADAHVGPDPQSSMNCLRGVHRSHEEKGITMASTKFASKVLKGLMRKYVKNCGIRSVRRKKPLTNAKINAMLNTPQGASLHGVTVDHHSYAWAATAAWVSTLAEDGDRKDEIAKASKNTPFELGRISFASLVFKIAACGGEVAFPTAAQLHLMDEAAGDGVFLKHGRAKNDFFGIFFASTPSFLPFVAHSPRNAARALRRLYALALTRGLTVALAPTTPLFGAEFGEEFTHWEVETYFEIMMRFGANVSVDELKDYSIHSFRIWVACALMAADVPRHTIKRLLRWRGDLSLEIYARLNDEEWSQHVRGTYTAVVDSTIAARLASLGSIDLEQAALRLGGDAD